MGLKGVCDTFLSPLRWSAERRTTTPVPSSKEGNYGAGKQILQGQRLGSLQALTPRECYSRFIVARPSGPLSRHRERGWGERADTPVATLGAILCAVRIDFRLPPQINPYPAQPATGVLGQRPKRVLVPFTRVKGTPRRRAVQTKTFYTTCPVEGDYRLCHDRPAGRRAGCHPPVTAPRRQAPANFFIPPKSR